MTRIRSLLSAIFPHDNQAKRFLVKLSNGEILALGLLFAIPGICLAVAAKEPSLPSKLLIALVTELGFAFIIAWVIISTVDEREKKNMR